MKHPDLIRLARVTALLLALACAGQASAQTTAFTYQGRLTANGLPANGTYELRFDLRDAPTAGTAVGTAVNNSGVAVSNGVFTVTVDFGAGAFTGANRWLEIGVRTNGSVSAYAVLTPRQPVTSAPYAVQAVNAQTAASVTGTVPAASVTGTFTSSQIPNLDAAKITSGTVADARLSANVALLNGSPTFAGTVTATTFVGSGAFNWQTVSGTAQQAAANTGYLATNDTAQVTITLPAAPNVGEVVRVSGVGEGGWKVAQNAGQTILVANLGLVGLSWTSRDTNRVWQSVAASADGSKLVAVANNGQIYTSTDSGVTWTERDFNRNWRSVASSADGSKLVAVVYDDQIYTSTDSGVTWTARENIRNWLSVASSADGSKLVAVHGGGQIYTSTDWGVTWTPRDSSRNWTSVAAAADGSKLVAVANNGQIYTSHPNSTPGTAGSVTGGQSTAVELQYIGNNQFLPLSHEGTILFN